MRKVDLPYIACLVFLTGFFGYAGAQHVGPIKVNATNARAYRESLVAKIFGPSGFPYSILPESVSTNVNILEPGGNFPYNSTRYPAGNLDSVDKIVVPFGDDPVDFPFKANIYLFHPHNNNGKLFIYHSGHCAATAPAEDIASNGNGIDPGLVIPALVAEGYTVLAVPMLHYQATPPIAFGCGFNNHDNFFTDEHYPYPLGFFFKPLAASLNLLGRSNYDAIYMCGLSGGGWATSIYPAIDSSISIAIPVAGSWPMAVRNLFYPGGDYEQTYPALFSFLLDYHEIYALACLAPARKMLQINNRYDDCCFGGPVAHLYYVDSVSNALKNSNGEFRYYLDETGNRHAITERAVQVMLSFVSGQSGSLQAIPADTATSLSFYQYDVKNNFIVNTTPDPSPLKFSLLKAPGWLSLDNITGMLSGTVPQGNIFDVEDSVSFKVEDVSGRFVVYNYNILRKRANQVFFTKYDDPLSVYFLPAFSHSLDTISPEAAGLFYFNNPAISVTGVSILNNSLIRIQTNIPVTTTDLIAYNGFTSPAAVAFRGGLKMADFNFTRIRLNAVTKDIAVAGMMRFNTDTRKFEYFNGVSWITMH